MLLIPGILLVVRSAFDGILGGAHTSSSVVVPDILLDPAPLSYSFIGLFACLALISKPRFLVEWFRQPILSFLAFVLISTTFALLHDQKLISVLVSAQYLLIMAICAGCIQVSRMNAGVSLERLFCGIYFAYVLVMIVGSTDMMLYRGDAFTSDARPRFQGATVVLNPNDWGLSAAIFGVFAFARLRWRQKLHYGAMMPLTVSLVIVFLSGSRSAVLSMIIGLGSIILFRFRMSWLAYLVLAVSSGLVLTFSSPLVHHVTPDLTMWLRVGGEDDLHSLSGRTKIWEWYLSELITNPLVGYGLGYRRLVSETGLNLGDAVYISAHNSFLGAWDASGLLGLLFFLISLINVEIRLLTLSVRYCANASLSPGEAMFGDHAVTALGILHTLLVASTVEGVLGTTSPYFVIPFMYVLVVACVVPSRSFRRSCVGESTGPKPHGCYVCGVQPPFKRGNKLGIFFGLGRRRPVQTSGLEGRRQRQKWGNTLEVTVGRPVLGGFVASAVHRSVPTSGVGKCRSRWLAY